MGAYGARSVRWGAVAVVSAAAVLVGGLPATASPAVPTGLVFERAVTHTPVLAGTVSASGGGQVEGKFFARTAGATSWDVVDGATVAVTSGQVARLSLAAQEAGAVLEWTMQSCSSVCSASAPVQTGTVSPMLGAGARKGATRLPFAVGDRVQVGADVGSGNLLTTVQTLAVPGVSGDLPVTLVHNSRAVGADLPGADPSVPVGTGWTLGVTARLVAQDDGSVVFYGPGGLTDTFTPDGAGSWAPFGGLVADLTEDNSGYRLTDRVSRTTWVFDADGHLVELVDRNDNTHHFDYDPYRPGRLVAITATKGPANLDVTFTYTGDRITSIRQGSYAHLRTVQLAYNAAGDLVTVTDPAGRATTVEYDAHRVQAVTAPGGIRTEFTHDARNRVTAIRQVNTAAGSPGDSWTRLAYTSPTQVLVSDGAQERAGSPTTGPRTTYTLTGDRTGRVSEVVDAQGRSRSVTFTPNFDPATTTLGAGTTGATSSFSYDANDGDSLTGAAAPGGATRSWGYDSTDPATSHLPTSGTDDAGNQSLYTYNGAGNALSSTDALAAEAAVTRNPDGTVASATGPGNGSNATTYTYANAQLTKVTPVTGSTLGAQDFTYDHYGRLETQTNGRGITTTYGYDVLDRVVAVDHSDTPGADVTYTYDTAGRLGTRTDTHGTTTYTYDDLSNLTGRTNTFNNRPITYTYDKAGRLASKNDSGGLVTYTYDTAGALTAMQYPSPGGGRGTTRFATDDRGRRTDTWMRTNTTNTRWAAHTGTEYDATGRPARITGARATWVEEQLVTTTVTDLRYCYATGSTYPACSADPADDRAFVQWRSDEATGQVTSYTYDGAGRLTQAATTAGTSVDGDPLPAVTYDYTYDARGNRTGATTTTDGTVTDTQTRTHNPANQTTTTGFTYDGAGNLTTDPTAGTITYTGGDQMATVTRGATTYTYAYAGTGNNELLTHTTPNGTYTYTYGRESQVPGRPVIEQVTRNGATAHLDHDPTGHPVQLRTSTGQDLLYVYDNIGSPVALITNFNTTAFQYSFDPYGVAEVDQTSGGNAIHQTPFLHTGGLHDRTTGWIKQGARYYNPTEGRWTQRDTLDAPLDPLNANRYAYAANNPVNFIDPDGRSIAVAIDIVRLLGAALNVHGISSMLAATSTQEQLAQVVGYLAGAVSTFLCYGAAAALGFVAGPVGFFSAVVCEGAGWLVNQAIVSL